MLNMTEEELDAFQLALGAGGMTPGVGNFADLADAGISLGRGDLLGALLAGLSAIPLLGMATGGMNTSRKAAKAAKAISEAKAAKKIKAKGVLEDLGASEGPLMPLISPELSGGMAARRESLVSPDRSDAAKAFMEAYESGTEPHLITPDYRTWGDRGQTAIYDEFVDDPGLSDIHLEMIKSFEKGQGQGSDMLKDITRMADEAGATISLEPMQKGGPLSTDELRRWYEGYGFKATGKGSDVMVRNPLAEVEPEDLDRFVRAMSDEDLAVRLKKKKTEFMVADMPQSVFDEIKNTTDPEARKLLKKRMYDRGNRAQREVAVIDHERFIRRTENKPIPAPGDVTDEPLMHYTTRDVADDFREEVLQPQDLGSAGRHGPSPTLGGKEVMPEKPLGLTGTDAAFLSLDNKFWRKHVEEGRRNLDPLVGAIEPVPFKLHPETRVLRIDYDLGNTDVEGSFMRAYKRFGNPSRSVGGGTEFWENVKGAGYDAVEIRNVQKALDKDPSSVIGYSWWEDVAGDQVVVLDKRVLGRGSQGYWPSMPTWKREGNLATEMDDYPWEEWDA